MPRKFEKLTFLALAVSVALPASLLAPAPISAVTVLPVSALALFYCARHVLAGFTRWQLYPFYIVVATSTLPLFLTTIASLLPASAAAVSNALLAVPPAPSWLALILFAASFLLDRVLFPLTPLPLPPGPHQRLRLVRHRFAALVPVPREGPLVDEYPDSSFPPQTHPQFYGVPGARLSAAAQAVADRQAVTAAEALAAAFADARRPDGAALSDGVYASSIYKTASTANAAAKDNSSATDCAASESKCESKCASNSADVSSATRANPNATAVPLHAQRPFEVLDMCVHVTYPAAAAHGGDRGDGDSYLAPYLSPYEASATASFASLPVWLFSSLQMVTQHVRTPSFLAPCPPPAPAAAAAAAAAARGAPVLPVPLPAGVVATLLPAGSPAAVGAAALAAALDSTAVSVNAGAALDVDAVVEKAAKNSAGNAVKEHFKRALTQLSAILPKTTSATKTAPTASTVPASSPSSWPVVILSHGLGGTAEMYATTAQALASYGHIVVAPTHTDGSASVALPFTATDVFYSRPQGEWLVRRRRRKHILGDPAAGATAAADHGDRGSHHAAREESAVEDEEELEPASPATTRSAGDKLALSALHSNSSGDAGGAGAADSGNDDELAQSNALRLSWTATDLDAASIVVNLLPATAEAMGGASTDVASAEDHERAAAALADKGSDSASDAAAAATEEDNGWDPLQEYKTAIANVAANSSAAYNKNASSSVFVAPLCAEGYTERSAVRMAMVFPTHLERKLEREIRATQLQRRVREVRFVVDVLTVAERALWAPDARIGFRSDCVAEAPGYWLNGAYIAPPQAAKNNSGAAQASTATVIAGAGPPAPAAAAAPSQWAATASAADVLPAGCEAPRSDRELVPTLPFFPAIPCRATAALLAPTDGDRDQRPVVVTSFSLGDIIPSLRVRTYTVAAGDPNAAPTPVADNAPADGQSNSDVKSAPKPLGVGTGGASLPSSSLLTVTCAAVPAPPAGRFDLVSRLWTFGHSFGGATALLSGARDPRLRSVATADPWIYPTPPLVTHADVPLAGEKAVSEILPPPPKGARGRALARVGRRPAVGVVLGGVGARWALDGERALTDGYDNDCELDNVNGAADNDNTLRARRGAQNKNNKCISNKNLAAIASPTSAGLQSPALLSRRPLSRLTLPFPHAVPALTLVSDRWEKWLIHHNAIRRMVRFMTLANPLSALALMPGTLHSNFMDAPFWSPATSTWLEASGTTDPASAMDKCMTVVATFAAATVADAAATVADSAANSGSGDPSESEMLKHVVATRTPGGHRSRLASKSAASALTVGRDVSCDWVALERRPRVPAPTMAAAMLRYLRAALSAALTSRFPSVPATPEQAAAANAAARSAALAAALGIASAVSAGSAGVTGAGFGTWSVVEEAALHRGPGSAPASAGETVAMAVLAGGRSEAVAAAQELLRRLDDDQISVDALVVENLETVATEALI